MGYYRLHARQRADSRVAKLAKQHSLESRGMSLVRLAQSGRRDPPPPFCLFTRSYILLPFACPLPYVRSAPIPFLCLLLPFACPPPYVRAAPNLPLSLLLWPCAAPGSLPPPLSPRRRHRKRRNERHAGRRVRRSLHRAHAAALHTARRHATVRGFLHPGRLFAGRDAPDLPGETARARAAAAVGLAGSCASPRRRVLRLLWLVLCYTCEHFTYAVDYAGVLYLYFKGGF